MAAGRPDRYEGKEALIGRRVTNVDIPPRPLNNSRCTKEESLAIEIFVFAVPGGFEWILPTRDAAFETFFSLDGRRQSGWQPPEMKILSVGDDGQPLHYSDFPWLGSDTPILRERAVELLKSDLERYGELLPLDCTEPVWLFNVTEVVDALDLDKSTIVPFDDGTIMTIEQHVFNPHAIGDIEIFKLPIRASSVYVSRRIVDRIRELGLEGVDFEPVWPGLRGVY
ncbi:imm11 family protein [Sphingomonas sp. DT-204]|uniref:imm11 family protein n=1 Tax=Sphingomonas sp. DT-204 TaxID=3396166 RepID=UPI003F1ABA43